MVRLCPRAVLRNFWQVQGARLWPLCVLMLTVGLPPMTTSVYHPITPPPHTHIPPPPHLHEPMSYKEDVLGGDICVLPLSYSFVFEIMWQLLALRYISHVSPSLFHLYGVCLTLEKSLWSLITLHLSLLVCYAAGDVILKGMIRGHFRHISPCLITVANTGVMVQKGGDLSGKAPQVLSQPPY